MWVHRDSRGWVVTEEGAGHGAESEFKGLVTKKQLE